MRKEREGALHVDEHSPTASTRGSEVQYPTSGVISYRVVRKVGDEFATSDVDAATGDEAAAKVVAKHPGCKVAYVGPTPQVKETAE